MLTRANQQPNVIYRIDAEELPSGTVRPLAEYQYVVTPDGEGRYFYDSLAEAQEQHGDDLPVRQTTLAWEA